MNVFNKNKQLSYRYFKIKENKYSIIGTIFDLSKPDVVTNLETGKQKKFNRSDLIKFLKSNNAVGYIRL